MKKIFLTLGILSAFVANASAQQRNCAANDVLQQQLLADPSLQQRMDAIEEQTTDFARTYTGNDRVVITIPVVFHVVYRNAAENISDAVLQSQIDVLNADFRKLNADAGLVPSAFSGLAADAEIQFCLAKRTPTGGATTGINRYSSTRTTDWGTGDAVKKTAQGGIAPWDATKYLNIWVCSIGGGILGYAQFPGGSASTDGVVLDYKYTGVTGATYAPYNKGRTGTHEVGHWLNLRHIWGDANCGSDLVTDTPTQQTSNYGCPAFPHVTCSNGANGDMFMNYMDYTDDACMYMFSAGQKARMQALFATGGARVGLVTSNGCTPPTTGGTCGTPTGMATGSITASSASVSWTALSGASSYTLYYKTAAATTYSSTSTTATSVSLSALTASTTYNWYVVAVCSGTNGTATAVQSFTTTAATTGCTDTYEANETRTAGKVIAVNTNISAKIGTSTDKDWFKFTTTASAAKIKVDLSGLTQDYDVKLYNNSGTQLGVSQNSGTAAEQIKYNTATTGATYYVQVYGYNGVFDANNCYTLRVSTGSANWRTDGSVGDEEFNEIIAEPVVDLFTVYPNPTENVATLQFFPTADVMMNLTVTDLMGKVVMQQRNAVSKDGNQTVQLDFSNLSAGLYIIRADDGTNSTTQKLVVQH